MDSTSDEAFAGLLRELHGWQRRGDSIWRTYQFDDFGSAAGSPWRSPPGPGRPSPPTT